MRNKGDWNSEMSTLSIDHISGDKLEWADVWLLDQAGIRNGLDSQPIRSKLIKFLLFGSCVSLVYIWQSVCLSVSLATQKL